MSTQRLYLVAYDISEDKRRAFVHYRLKPYSRVSQLSSFECWLTEYDKQQIIELLQLSSDESTVNIEPNEDLACSGPNDAYGIIAIRHTYWQNASKANQLTSRDTENPCDPNHLYIS